MTNEEKLQFIKNIRNYILEIIENIRFDNKETFYLSIARIKEVAGLMKVLDALESNIDEYDNFLAIIASKDTVIYPEKETEIATNVTGYHFDEDYDIIFNGFIPKLNGLKLNSDKEKMKVYIKNMISLSDYDNEITYSNPFDIDDNNSSIYKIKQGTIIGMITKKQEKTNIITRSMVK